MPDYLQGIPARLAYRGDVTKGEIQIQEPQLDRPEFGVVYEDQYIKVLRDPVLFPNGAQGGYVRVVNQTEADETGGCVVVPRVEDKIVFVRLFRHATRTWEIELPRGFQDPGISAEENVRKEVQEELGVTAAAVTCAGMLHPNTGLLASSVGVYVAQLEQLPDLHNHGGDPEIHSRHLVPVADLDRYLREAPVRCGISLAAIFLARLEGLL